jgi:glucosamine 6-phosphate synthetase-like amidotransferase/phosphosugar isomerase protein
LVLTGVMHYFSYQVAVVLDRPIDKPRNLAKSVTIE